MNLTQLQRHYKITLLELIKILAEKNIDVDLRKVAHVPLQWHTILSEHTSIAKPQENRPASNKKGRLTEDREYNQKEKPTVVNSFEDLGFATNSSKQKAPSNPIRNTGKDKKELVFLAYVKYMASDLSHGYVSKIDDINDLDFDQLNVKSGKHQFKIEKLSGDIKEQQIVLCKSSSERRNLAQIIKTYFEGSIAKIKNTIYFADWVSYSEPIIIENIRCEERILDDNFIAAQIECTSLPLQLTKVKRKIDPTAYQVKIEDHFKIAISYVELFDSDKFVVEQFRSSKSENYNSLIKIQFDADLGDSYFFEDNTKIKQFIFKWTYLEPNLLNSDLYFQKKLDSVFEVALKKDTFNVEDKFFIEEFSKNSQEDYNNFVKTQFKIDSVNKDNFDDSKRLEQFIQKWMYLNPEYLKYANFKADKLNHENILAIWLNNVLPIDFWEDQLLTVLFSIHKDRAASSEIITQPEQWTNSHKDIFKESFPSYLNTLLSIDSLDDYRNLKKLIEFLAVTDEESYTKIINNKLSSELKLKLWLEDITHEFPRQEAIKHFPRLDKEVQETVIDLLSDEEVFALFPSIKEQNESDILERLKKIASKYIIADFSPVSFDIESDTIDIKEIAWGYGDTYFSCKDRHSIDKKIEEFAIEAADKKKLLIGHNIIDFDCPILENHNVVFHREKLWDTFLIEMLLSPDLKNFALKTEHNAEYDTKFTFNLFVNQVLRILKKTKEDLAHLYAYLPEPILASLEKLRAHVSLNYLSMQDIESKRLVFFRPQPTIHPIIEQLKVAIAASIKKNKIVIGDEIFKLSVLSVPNISFIEEKSPVLDYSILNEDRVEQLEVDNQWYKQALLSFCKYCKLSNHKPYWANLPIAIRMKVKENVDVFGLLNEESIYDWTLSNTLFIKADQLYNIKENINEENTDVFVIDPAFLSISNKTLLKETDSKHLFDNSGNDHFWMKFSGGQSFVGLTKEQCVTLGVEIPEMLTNFWVEKYQFGKYRIWGNSNWEQDLKRLQIKWNQIKLNIEDAPKQKVNYVVINTSKSKRSEITRFNPESIYRSRYWVFQKELVKQISEQQKPTILLIQRKEEIPALENYFATQGFFIPDRKIALGRRLEFLHLNKGYHKIIIATENSVGSILQANYLGALNVVLDSFYLGENFFTSKETEFFKDVSKQMSRNEEDYSESSDENDEEDFTTIALSSKPLIKDIYFLLQLENPSINHLRNLLASTDEGHKLWLLDPRIDDFPGLSEKWNATKRVFNVWSDIDSYNEDLMEAEIHIESPQPINNLPFKLEEQKKILAAVFLPDGNNWYPEQEEYLDLILPGQTDLLISMPTGGGKSLLFQAPALFKSSFTNRLTIVITPLKALMEDQVKSLWNLGFVGSVDYINSDRSSDTRLIYRSLAGGELALLFITPERFRSNGFLKALSMRLQSDGGLEYAVFDEAHCVSQWGQEFRPDYYNGAKEISRIKKSSEPSFPILLFSATVSEKIYNDLNTVFS